MPPTEGHAPRPGPLAYFLTFTCYGSHLHGQGPFHYERSTEGTKRLPPNRKREYWRRQDLKQPPFLLDAPRRTIVLRSILQTADYRGWTIHAAHVRSNHIHVVVSGPPTAQKAFGTFNAYASRHLTESGFDTNDRRRWTRHGSHRALHSERGIIQAVHYVIDQTGDPMSLFDGATTWPTA